MRNKAQMNQIGGILIAFVGVVVGIALYLAVVQTIGPATQTSLYNTTSGSTAITVPANGVTIDLTGQELIGTPVVVLDNGTAHNSANYTIDEGVSTTTGVKTVRYTSDSAENAGATANLTYTYGADGYIDNSGARSLAGLIAIFAALAIAIVALSPTLRSGALDLMKK